MKRTEGNAKRSEASAKKAALFLDSPGGVHTEMAFLQEQEERQFWIIHFVGASLQVEAKERITGRGEEPPDPADVIRAALLRGSTTIIYVFNQPDPALADEEITAFWRLQKVAESMKVQLVDQVVIGNQCYNSARFGDSRDPLKRQFERVQIPEDAKEACFQVLARDDCFCARIAGTEIGGIKEGDYVICSKEGEIGNGDLVVLDLAARAFPARFFLQGSKGFIRFNNRSRGGMYGVPSYVGPNVAGKIVEILRPTKL